MSTLSRIAALFLLALASCGTVGVEISEQETLDAIGFTADEVRELYGVPHVVSLNTEGEQILSYGFEEYCLWNTETKCMVEFYFMGGFVTKVSRSYTRGVADKNRSH